MAKHLLIRYHEVALKGKNQRKFVDQLAANVRHALSRAGLSTPVRSERGQILADLPDGADPEPALRALARVFGIAKIAVALRTGLAPEEIDEGVRGIVDAEWGDSQTFRISASRSDKRYPLTSVDLNYKIGSLVQGITHADVDLRNPDIDIRVDVRERGAYIYVESVKGSGGLPVGSSGHVAAMLSGGIDSPVAAARAFRRGCTVDFIHFHSFPLVEGASRDKALDLVRVLNDYQHGSRLHLVPFSEAQRHIVAAVNPAYRVIAYRRFMVRVAEAISQRVGAIALVTGESIGQVASQTIENIASIDAVATMPILRPLVGMDKQEIINEARQIGTYDISILPDEDCCSLFVPKHPALRSKPAEAARYEASLDVDSLVARSVEATKTVTIPAR